MKNFLVNFAHTNNIGTDTGSKSKVTFDVNLDHVYYNLQYFNKKLVHSN